MAVTPDMRIFCLLCWRATAGVCGSHDVERSPDTDEQRHQRTRESDATAAEDAEVRETPTAAHVINNGFTIAVSNRGGGSLHAGASAVPELLDDEKMGGLLLHENISYRNSCLSAVGIFELKMHHMYVCENKYRHTYIQNAPRISRLDLGREGK